MISPENKNKTSKSTFSPQSPSANYKPKLTKFLQSSAWKIKPKSCGHKKKNSTKLTRNKQNGVWLKPANTARWSFIKKLNEEGSQKSRASFTTRLKRDKKWEKNKRKSKQCRLTKNHSTSKNLPKTESRNVSLSGTTPKINTFKTFSVLTSTIRTPSRKPWTKSTKSDKNNSKKITSTNKSLEISQKNTMTKIIVNKPSWISKNSSKKWKTKIKKIKIKTKPKAYPQWNSCKWPKKNKSKKTSMTLTNLSINSKTKIPNKLLSTVMMKILKISKKKRKALIKMMKNNKFQEKCTVPKILKVSPRIIQAIIWKRSNSSRKTFSRHFFLAIMWMNWQRASTSKTSKTSTSPKELTWNSMRSYLKWTEIFLTTLKLKMKLY